MVLAVDLGGTKTAIARVGEDGAVHDLRMFPAEHSLEGSVAQIAGAASDCEAVGVIVPGIYNAAIGHAWCPNLWGPEQVPLLHALRDRIALDVFIDSDRAGYVLGESWLGAARGLRHVIFVAIGTGIGVGIIADGRVLRGAAGIAGAAGWFALTPEWREAYAAVGCWEAESAGPSVARQAGMNDAAAVVSRRGPASPARSPPSIVPPASPRWGSRT